jgi:hypothetical protein
VLAMRPGMIVAFRASVPVRMTRRPLQYDDLWGDQPTPPPPVAADYGPGAPEWRVWPPRYRSSLHEDETPQQSRIRRSLFMLDRDLVKLDEARCRFTYTRCTLVGTIELDEERARVWTMDGWSEVNAVTALGPVLLLLRCALHQCYEIRPPEHKTISGIPLPKLTITLREVSR